MNPSTTLLVVAALLPLCSFAVGFSLAFVIIEWFR